MADHIIRTEVYEDSSLDQAFLITVLNVLCEVQELAGAGPFSSEACLLRDEELIHNCQERHHFTRQLQEDRLVLLNSSLKKEHRWTDGHTPLHYAASRGQVGVAELLLKNKAEVDSKAKSGVTPLYCAASGGHVGVAKLLLEAGAEVDSREELQLGDTPLHEAASGGHVGVAELLLKAGAQVDSKNKDGKTPIDVAKSEELSSQDPSVKKSQVLEGRKKILTLIAAQKMVWESSTTGTGDILRLCFDRPSNQGVRLVIPRTNNRTPWLEGLPKQRRRMSPAPVVELSLLDKYYSEWSIWTLNYNKQWRIRSTENLTVKHQEKAVARLLDTRSPAGLVGAGLRMCNLLFYALFKHAGARFYRRKVGPEGCKLQTKACTVTVPPRALTIETEITCQIINPNEVNLPLEDGAMLVSDIVELHPHGTTFHQPVTVQMKYNCSSLGDVREAAVWATEGKPQWVKQKTTKESEDKLAVSVNQFSMFAVISHPKTDRFTVPTEGFKLESSTQSKVQISFPKQAVNTPTEITLQVQEVPLKAVEDIKAKDQSSRSLIATSPIVHVETVLDSQLKFQEPVTVRVPHPQLYMKIQHEGPTKLRVMSCEEGTEDWVDETETDNINIRVTEDSVEFEHRAVQFILMQREDNANEVIIECAPTEDVKEKRATLLQEGYKGPLPTDSVELFEGQMVEISLLGNVSIASFGFGSSTKQQITFHSQKDNRLHMQVMALKAKDHQSLDGKGTVVFFVLPHVEVRKEEFEKHGGKKVLLREGHEAAKDPTDERFKQLCQLPIVVPYETPELTPEYDPLSLKGIEKCFFFVKQNVSTDWVDLAFHLGIDWADIKNIGGKNPDDKSRCFDMLWEWKKLKGNAATAKVLMEALTKSNLQSVVDGLKDQYADIGAAKAKKSSRTDKTIPPAIKKSSRTDKTIPPAIKKSSRTDKTIPPAIKEVFKT
ncbi:positive regulation of extrinsic apoptotic signaling pathway via death domain receptors protein [Branchiostoma belcheri]|nr:positive regulation of extrinsic apoptotic signaling pathway via death domain receptors protein [Branchiostoma belcheri]